MSNFIESSSISRRSVGRLGILLTCGALVPALHLRKAEAAILTSWDFSENDNLDVESIAERFEQINGFYEIGQSFSDSDSDFVLRYADTSLFDGKEQVCSKQDGGESGCELNVTSSEEYKGEFLYRCSAVVQAGCSDDICQQISIREKRTVYGWTYPFGDGSFGIIDQFECEYQQDNESWFAAEFVDEFTGIAVGFHVQYEASITLPDGSVIELSLKD